jgi:hypothetical protein
MVKISRKNVIGLVVLLIVVVSGIIIFPRDKFGDVKKAVKYVLKDPDSAEFRNITISSKSDGVFCGEVNARNSNNGYAGFHSFVYDRALNLVVIMNKYSDQPGLMLEGLKYFQTRQCTGPYLD